MEIRQKVEDSLHRRTLNYLRKSMSNFVGNKDDESKSTVSGDAALAERYQSQYLQLYEIENRHGRRLNEELFFQFISEDKTPIKKTSKSVKFLRMFRCSDTSETNENPTTTNEKCIVDCQCCYDEIEMSESAMCESDHIFCKQCVIRGTDLAISNGQSLVRCFVDCDDEIATTTLRNIVSDKTFEILMKKRQEDEIAAARLDFLEACPFCPYQMELDVDVRTFYCQNPECMRVSCRSCKKTYHYDVACEDVIDEHKGRLFVEEEMSEALIRKCYNCKKPFVLWDGCNKIQCSCGATMCYRCRQPITGYSHFDQTGGCQLHEDSETLDKIQVEQRRVKAIAELHRDFPGLKIPKI